MPSRPVAPPSRIKATRRRHWGDAATRRRVRRLSENESEAAGKADRFLGATSVTPVPSALAALQLEIAALLDDVVVRAADGTGEHRAGEDRQSRDRGEHELGH